MKALTEYTRKRDFKKTIEPAARVRKGKVKNLLFVVQEHHASHLHYDFRLEWNGVLKSWAVPKGPTLDPGQKRLAVEVEDHPYDYWKFEGVIPAKEYGGGEVYRWDTGTWIPKNDFKVGLAKGRLEFELKGKKLKGEFLLVRTGRQASKPTWLLIKRNDKYAKKGAQLEPIADYGRGKILKSRTTTSARKAKKTPAPADLPDFTSPQLAQLVDRPPKGQNWVHEIKFDGYRIQAHVAHEDGPRVRIFTRNGHDWTSKYQTIVKKLEQSVGRNCVFDGEVVWQDKNGRSHFQKLQKAMKSKSTDALIYYVFDLLFLDDQDLRRRPLIERKALLKKLVDEIADPQIRFSEHFQGVGEGMIQASCNMNLEGIICKKADAPYVSGRQGGWLKVKCGKRQEFVIGGFTEPAGSRHAFGSLLLGYYKHGELTFAGKCGSGFDQKLLRELNKTIRKLESKRNPFMHNVPKDRGLHWIRPKLVCEVAYAEMTEGGHLRAPIFKGLRSDKAPEDIVMEVPKSSKRPQTSSGSLSISHPNRIIYPKEKLTKRDVAEYYKRVSPLILPHLEGRPLSLVRCQQNAVKGCFFAKHLAKLPDNLNEIPDTEGKDPWIGADSEEGLLQLIQWGTLEIHPWGCARGQIDSPNMIIMDFDPDEGLDFDLVKQGAYEMHDLLKQLGLKSFVKTTGGKGLHVVFPFEPLYNWDTIKSFAKTLTQEMVSRHPDLYTGKMAKKLRRDKIFLDYLRNGRGATAVAPYSLRARSISAVAMPVEWTDLQKMGSANFFTLPKTLDWLKKRKKDPWANFFKIKQKIRIL